MKIIKNILLIDDDEIFVYLTIKIIKDTGFEGHVEVFGNGKDALDFLFQYKVNIKLMPEVIFLDLNMPILDGWGFLEEYTVLKPKIKKKIILYIVSSSISPHDFQRAKTISVVTDFIIKPVTKEKFVEVVKKYVPVAL